MVNDAGDRFDIYLSLAGVQQTLAEGGWVLPIDGSRLKNWAGVSSDVKDIPPAQTGCGRQNWGVPIYMNADTFGYFPALLDEPRPPDPRLLGPDLRQREDHGPRLHRRQLFQPVLGCRIHEAAGLADIKDSANMTASEVETVADYMIERKKAGQFRNLWNTLRRPDLELRQRRVLAMPCWEPAVKDARGQGLDVVYAVTDEFYIKWMQAAFIPSQAEDRNLDEIYTAIDWLLGGGYAATLTPLRGYVTSRPDLGLEYAKEMEHGRRRGRVDGREPFQDRGQVRPAGVLVLRRAGHARRA